MRKSSWLNTVLAFAVLMPAGAQTVPTYTGEVSDILRRHCVGCHTRGGVGRVALDTYQQASAFAREIENTSNNRQMPPLFAVPGYGEFRNENPLSGDEIKTLVRWVDAGSPQGQGKADRAPEPQRTWRSGKPGIILQTQPYIVSGGLGFEKRCFAFPTNRAAPQAVRMIDILPGDRRVVSQVRVSASLQPPDRESSASQSCRQAIADEANLVLLGEWVPHVAPDPLPIGVGRLLPARATVIVEVTYQKVGVPVTDATRIGLYFQPATRFVHTMPVSNHEFAIPADEWDYRVDAAWTVDREITLLSITPSMRRLGMEMRIVATFPSGTSETLLWVRDYDYNRKQAYQLKVPKLLPSGTRITVAAAFNNSDSNSKLPRGKQSIVRTGPSATDEQMAAFLEYVDGTF